MDAAAHELWQDPPVARAGPRDVREVQDRRLWDLATDHGGRKIKVVILEEDVRRFMLLLRFVDDGFCDRFVYRDIAAFPGFVNCASDVRSAGRVPHEVLDEPKQRVAEDVVVTLVRRLGDGHKADVDLVVRHVKKSALCSLSGETVSVSHGGRHPCRGDETGG